MAEPQQEAHDARAGPDVAAADLVRRRLSPPCRLLIVGCGTGQLATVLTARGYAVTGVDADPGRLAVARARDALTRWVLTDPDRLALPGPAFDLAVLASVVVTGRARGRLVPLLARVARHVRPGGEVLAGMPLTPTAGEDAWSAADYDRACAGAALAYVVRYADWSGAPYHLGEPYAVSVHRVR